MKKIVAVILTAILTTTILAGCNNQNKSKNEQNEITKESSVVAQKTDINQVEEENVQKIVLTNQDIKEIKEICIGIVDAKDAYSEAMYKEIPEVLESAVNAKTDNYKLQVDELKRLGENSTAEILDNIRLSMIAYNIYAVRLTVTGNKDMEYFYRAVGYMDKAYKLVHTNKNI